MCVCFGVLTLMPLISRIMSIIISQNESGLMITLKHDGVNVGTTWTKHTQIWATKITHHPSLFVISSLCFICVCLFFHFFTFKATNSLHIQKKHYERIVTAVVRRDGGWFLLVAGCEVPKQTWRTFEQKVRFNWPGWMVKAGWRFCVATCSEFWKTTIELQ